MSVLERWTLLLHAAATLFMVGLIWFVQVVHYPLFDGVGESGYREYQTRHQNRVTLIVGPVMLLEALTAAALLYSRPSFAPVWLLWVGAGLLVVIWASTAFLQMPRHEVLSGGFDAAVHQGLVMTNWIRTVAWSLRGALALMVIDLALGKS